MYAYNRLTDNDRNFGPITIGERSKTWRPLRATIESGDEEHPGCCIQFGALGWLVRIAIPSIIKPWRQWVDTSKYPWSNPAGGHWDIHRREYGFSLSDGFLQVFFGAQTDDSATDQNWCAHLPWTQWRFVGTRYYDLAGNLFESVSQKQKHADHRAYWAAREALQARIPKVRFAFDDFDGERIHATCHIEESECHFGKGWFTWLGFFRPARLRRSMHIEFDKEVGREKGSWKGGTLGHGIDLLPGELHEAAFRRYCAEGSPSRRGEKGGMTFIGQA
ncbi:MAG: hypothetical protein V4669_13810 [Pseudomonadota bacterium]